MNTHHASHLELNDFVKQLSILSQSFGVVMMRQTLILAILHSQVCRGFVFSPSPMENSVEDIPLEYNDESLNFVSQEIMEKKTENEFDDKVPVLVVKGFFFTNFIFLDRKRDRWCCCFLSLFCCVESVW